MIRVTVYPTPAGTPLILEPIVPPTMLPNGWVHLEMGDGRSELLPPTTARITIQETGPGWCGDISGPPFPGQICIRNRGHGGMHSNGAGGHNWVLAEGER